MDRNKSTNVEYNEDANEMKPSFYDSQLGEKRGLENEEYNGESNISKQVIDL